MRVTPLTAIIHVFANRENLLNSARREMCAGFHRRHDLLELRKISFLLSREKRKPFEKRNNVLYDGAEVSNLVIPNAIRSTSKSSTAQVFFEEREYYSVLLRHIETDGYLPGNRVVLTWSKRDVEASFTIRKTRQV